MKTTVQFKDLFKNIIRVDLNMPAPVLDPILQQWVENCKNVLRS